MELLAFHAILNMLITKPDTLWRKNEPSRPDMENIVHVEFWYQIYTLIQNFKTTVNL